VELLAPAKLNLCLYVGQRGANGLHEIASLFQPLALADRLTLTPAERDEVVCPGVEGPNLAMAALDELRARGWGAPSVRVEIEKQIPVAAGLGGGSADAGAVLRAALGGERDMLGVEGGAISGAVAGEIAAGIGSDVPSQIEPGFALVTGTGERIERLPPPAAHALVLVPLERGLSAAEVYAGADRLGPGRERAELEQIAARLRAAADGGASPLDYLELLVNDLQPAVLALRPEAGAAIEALEREGAARALVTGSGPTVFGLFADRAAAERAAAALADAYPAALATIPDREG